MWWLAGSGHQDVYDFVEKNAKELDQAIEYDRDLGYDYFGAFAVTPCVFLFIFPYDISVAATWNLDSELDLVFLRFQDPWEVLPVTRAW